LIRYAPTPVQEIHHETLHQAGVRLLVKREDLNHPFISGNKWWKLKYNLEEAFQQKKKTLLTFGGAYSNHIYAAAAAAREAGFESIGIIRGEETLPLNHTLTFAKSCGMKIHYVSREEYRSKEGESFIKKLQNLFGDFYLIPEGGTNELAVKGCAEFAEQHLKEINADYICVAVGTGGTIAGIIEGFLGEKKIVGFPVLKGGEFFYNDIKDILPKPYSNWHLETAYHFGGYAKSTRSLTDFIAEMKSEHDLLLDQVYTAKLLWGVLECVKAGKFRRKSTVLVLHSGGLQNASNFTKHGSV
jgi:1-aminocyclopropane-1-carboxylate deaminase